VRVELYKDATPEAVTELKGIQFKMDYLNGAGDKFDTIIACEATIVFQIDRNGSLTYADFLITYKTEWKVIAKVDGVVVFTGWLTPGEGNSEFQDPPYDIVLSATDGLGLLKGVVLSDTAGDDFIETNTVISYIAGALHKTGLDLNILLLCNIYEQSMTDRFTDPAADAFNQAKLDYRTFQKDAVTFVDCYAALELILREHFSIYQWNGKWAILRIAEMQDIPGPKIWHTEYDYTGTALLGEQYEFGPCQVGKDAVLHPINRTNFISSRFAIKSAKHTYNYDVWPEIPKNNKFERGSLLFPIFGNVFAKDANGNDTPDQIGTYQGYDIDDWTKGDFTSGSPSAITNLPALGAPTGSYARLSYNNAGNEFDRIVAITHPGGVNKAIWLQSEGLKVKQGDRVNFSTEFALSYNSTFPGGDAIVIGIASVYIIDGNGDKWAWRYRPTLNNIENLWLKVGGTVHTISARFEDGNATKNFTTVSAESPTIPVSGTMYVVLVNSNQDSLATPPYVAYFKKFNFEYKPFIAGGFLPVQGDYWFTSQNQDIDDVVDEQVYLSDSEREVFKGALLRSDNELTTTWHRLNVAEERQYKELLNLGRYNHAYRRMWRIDGDFGGTRFNAVDNPVVNEPLSFHKHFYFKDAPELGGRMFMLVPPLSIDYSQGETGATFVECFDFNSTLNGAIIAGQLAQQFKDYVNASGTSAVAFDGSSSIRFKLFINDSNVVTVTANDGGVGNFPSMMIVSTIDSPGPKKFVEIEIGINVQPGNTFRLQISGAGIDTTITSTSLVTFSDGNQVGDAHEFKYIIP
jgi:hypothetical protein